jgi:acetyl esterase/lipase
MSTPNSFSVDGRDFDPAVISNESRTFNANLQLITSKLPKWYEIGAAEYRRLRSEGNTALPGLTLLPNATDLSVPSCEPNRTIPCRVLKPQHDQPVKAVFMHIHSGGWCLSNEKSQDQMLQEIADTHGVVCLSVGYRLAPENPFPAGPHDCFDVAEWLVENAESALQAPLAFVGGDSAGAHLSMLVALHLLQHTDARFSEFRFRGMILHYGCYSLRWTPGVYSFARRVPSLVLDLDTMGAFRDAFIPGWSQETLENPDVSPLYADLASLRGKLPPALFTCGTEDYLLDDTLYMSMRWLAAGGSVDVKLIPGAPHGFISFPRTTVGSGAAEGRQAADDFFRKHL